jgi:hypothetical protein
MYLCISNVLVLGLGERLLKINMIWFSSIINDIHMLNHIHDSPHHLHIFIRRFFHTLYYLFFVFRK